MLPVPKAPGPVRVSGSRSGDGSSGICKNEIHDQGCSGAGDNSNVITWQHTAVKQCDVPDHLPAVQPPCMGYVQPRTIKFLKP